VLGVLPQSTVAGRTGTVAAAEVVAVAGLLPGVDAVHRWTFK
jgi:hypothetical protein